MTAAPTDAVRRSIGVVLSTDPRRVELQRQLDRADLEITASQVHIVPAADAVPAQPATSGPLNGVALVKGPDGEYQGEVLVWLDAGLLDSAEFAWVTDEAPDSWPTPDQMSIG